MVIKNLMAAEQTKRDGKFFKTFFFTKLQSKHVLPLAYNLQNNDMILEVEVKRINALSDFTQQAELLHSRIAIGDKVYIPILKNMEMLHITPEHFVEHNDMEAIRQFLLDSMMQATKFWIKNTGIHTPAPITAGICLN